jgi:hypothetical protein
VKIRLLVAFLFVMFAVVWPLALTYVYWAFIA